MIAKKDVAGARQGFERALQIDATYLPAAIGLAGLDMLDKNVPQAKKRFETLLAADPKNATAMLAAAELVSRTGGSQEEVLDWINKAVAAKPADAPARLALINYYLRGKDAKKAASAAQDALAALPDQPEILDAVGRSQASAGDVNQAIITFGKMSSLQPDSPLPYLRMAEVQVADNKPKDAVLNLRRALKIRPNLLEAQSGLVTLELGLKRPEEALSIAREVQQQRPKEAAGYILEGDVHASARDWPKAVAALRNAVKQAPNSTQAAVKLNMALQAAGSKGESDAFAQSWVKEHPQDIDFRLHLGDRASAAKDYATAATHYRAALEKQPENPLILNNLAWVLGQAKNPKALEYAETANRLAPNQPALMDTLAGILADSGDTVRALDLLDRAVKMAPQVTSIRLTYASVLAKAGKKAEAKKELQELEKLGDKFSQQAEVKQLLGTL
jgi:putative PEP-CTERM system TPR-repeat lipoprotein